MQRRLAIVGSGKNIREWWKPFVYKHADDYLYLHPEYNTIISGGAPGIDTFARHYAIERELMLEEINADWQDFTAPCLIKTRRDGQAYNALAGFKRNKIVADKCDAALIFWNDRSPGTADFISHIKKTGKSYKIFYI